MCGLLIGAAGLGNLADLIGRKKALLVGMIGGLVTNASIYFVHDQYTFTIMRLLAGAFAHGVVVVGFVYMAEFVGPKVRSYVGAQYHSFFAVGYMLLSYIAYLERDYHVMQVYISLFAIPYFIFYWLIPTSPRWLYTKKRNSEAREILMKFSLACDNECDLDEDFLISLETSNDGQAKTRFTSLDVLRPKHMRRITFDLLYCWFVTSLIYYGLGKSTFVQLCDHFNQLV